ncbi:MAG: DUF1893 domain-containing protein [Bacteroidales bacterium]|nr:DUF1893 domain-containing protein [Bacteroidales bacterium]
MITDLVQRLDEGGFSCVISNGGEVRTFSQRSIADLYSVLKNDAAFLNGAVVADKVVGKGAAALLILGKIDKLYTHVISELALSLLQKSSIQVGYDKVVPHIINRTKTDWCPIEKRVKDCTTAAETLSEIEKFLADIKKT